MPGVLEEVAGGEREVAKQVGGGCKEAPVSVPELQNGARHGESLTPSPGLEESVTSDDAALNVSSASETETPKKQEATEEGQEAVALEGKVQKQEAKDSEGAKGDRESVVYNVQLSLPGVASPVDVVLTSRDSVHEVLQFAMERPECCYRTALSVHHKGKRLDDFFEIGSIEDLKDGDLIEVLEEPYTTRDVRLHLQRLKDLLSSNPYQQSMLSSDGLTLSFLSSIALFDPDDGGLYGGVDALVQVETPDYCNPQLLSGDSVTTDVPLSAYYPPNLAKHFKFPECLKYLGYSSWNPPPCKRRMKGDLVYLEVTTLEGQDFFITATPSGFFLNRSTSRENFDPTPRKTSHLQRHLVSLLSQISPLFKKNFAQLQKYGEGLHAFEILAVPYTVTPWVAPKQEHKPINFRIDDTMSLRALPEDLVLGQMRDWNEELQTARELPVITPSARVFRDKALFKIHSDFVRACTRGAQAVVEGYLPSLNPGEEPKFRMYMWNNIFFSLACDGRDYYKDLGGDNAAHAAASADLQGVTSFERLETKGLYTLGTVLVDYCGYRVVCQTIVPGLLQREHDSAVVYGSIDMRKNINTEERFVELLKKIAEQLHIREHKVLTDKGEVLSLPSSLEVKGIIGSDQRHYVLDLFRIFPPDANYMPTTTSDTERYRHKMAILRPEFLDTFLSFKFMLFLRLIKEKANSIRHQDGAVPNNSLAPSNSEVSSSAPKSSPTGATESSDTAESTDPERPSDSPVLNKSEGSKSPLNADTGSVAQEQTEMMDTPSSTAAQTVADDASTHNTAKTVDTTEGLGILTSEDSSNDRREPLPVSAFPSVLPVSPSKSIISQPDPLTKQAETPATSELFLIDGALLDKALTEEKEAGPDFPCGLADEDLSAMKESDSLREKEAKPPVEHEPAIFQESLLEAGSSSLEEFLVHFNVDILSQQVNHADEESVLEKDRTLVKDAACFLMESVVPRFVHDCIQLMVTPMDGESLSAAMHARGINMRYLGQVARLASLREDLQHIKHLCVSEMVARLAKRRLRQLLQNTPVEMISEAITHFLNCLLAEEKEDTKEEQPLTNGHARKKRNKKKSRGQKEVPHQKLTNENLWKEIVDEALWYYKYDTKCASLSELCSQTGIGKLSLLRDVCKKTGVQILLRDYDFATPPVFTEDDIIAVYPIVKHTNFRPSEPTALYEVALSKLSGGQVQVAHELLVNVLQMFVQVYGPMHLDTANCYRHLARIGYMVSDYAMALSNQHKATLILERVLGVDHPETVSAYINLALYCQASGQSPAALRLLYRARYLLLLMHGEDHPEMATCDSNIAVILHSMKDYKTSLTFLSNTLVIQCKYHGKESLQTALTHHLLARVHSFMGDFRAALNHEKVTYSIYQGRLGADHDKTVESSQCLKELTEKAVTMQKTINEMTVKGKGKLMVDLPGSWGEVVGMMNGMELRAQGKAKPQTHASRKKQRRVKGLSSPTGNAGQAQS